MKDGGWHFHVTGGWGMNPDWWNPEAWLQVLQDRWLVVVVAVAAILLVLKLVKTVLKWVLVIAIAAGVLTYGGYSVSDLTVANAPKVPRRAPGHALPALLDVQRRDPPALLRGRAARRRLGDRARVRARRAALGRRRRRHGHHQGPHEVLPARVPRGGEGGGREGAGEGDVCEA